jgi:predicted glycosyltransferase
MGGYNTIMNILATGVSALVWPFPQNREQRLRATRLAARGAVRLLDNADLDPSRLVRIMAGMLASPQRAAVDLNLDGAAATAEWIHQHVQPV